MWSSNAIPVANAVSNPFRLPVIGYDPWTSALDNATEYPFFIRTGPANSDISKVYGAYLRHMSFNSIAVVTDDDAFSGDFGQGVVDDMKKNGATVLYHGVFPAVPTGAAVDLKGRAHLDAMRSISSHLFRAKENNARIIFVAVNSDLGKIAMYMALKQAGYFGKGFAVIDGEFKHAMLNLDLIATEQVNVNGIVHLSVGPGTCQTAAPCPHTACGGPACAVSSRVMNQAYDAVYTMASALAPQFRTGGDSYLKGVQGTREEGMAAIRATSLSAKVAASGFLEFSGPLLNTRDKVRNQSTLWYQYSIPRDRLDHRSSIFWTNKFI